MTLSMYLRILRDRLEEVDVDEDTIKRVLVREQATVSGLSEEEAAPLFTEERLNVLVASTKKRSYREAQSKRLTLSQGEDETKTVRSKACEDDTALTQIPVSKRNASTDAVEKTIVPNVPKPLLENDTATVVISKDSPKAPPSQDPDKTTVMPTAPHTDALEKLLSQNDTVHISEKATVEFMTVLPRFEDEGKTILPSVSKDMPKDDSKTRIDATLLKLDEESTLTVTAPPRPHTVSINEDETILPFLDEAHREAKKKTSPPDPLSDEDSIIQVEESDLENRFPTIFSILILPILLPVLLLIGSVWLLIFASVSLILAIMTAFPILFYTALLAFSGGGTVYSIVYSVRYFISGSDANAWRAVLLFVGFALILALILAFLHRLVIPLAQFFKKKLFLFFKHNRVIFKGLIRWYRKAIAHA